MRHRVAVFAARRFRAETVALIGAMSVVPSPQRQAAINAWISTGLDAGWWAKLGFRATFAAHDEQASRLNWIAPSSAPVLATNSPTFTTDRGWTGDGVAAFLDTQRNWNAIPNVAQDSQHFATYARFDGNTQLAGTATNYATHRRVSTNYASRLGATSETQADVINAGVGVHLCESRSTSTGTARYINGVAGTAGVLTSTALATSALHGLRIGGSYGSNVASLRAMQAGAGLTAAEIASMAAADQAYMAAVGAA